MIWNQFLTRTGSAFPSLSISYSPVILFTEHWLFFLFLFGPLSHLKENEKGERKKKTKIKQEISKRASKYTPHIRIFIHCNLNWIGQITSGTVLGRNVIGSQPGVTAVCAVWPHLKENKSNKLKSRQILPPAAMSN